MARACGFTGLLLGPRHPPVGRHPPLHHSTPPLPSPSHPPPPPANLALAGTLTASNTLAGFPASAANDASQDTYWQAAGTTATLTLHLAQAAPVARIVLELPQDWGTRNQAIQIDGSANGSTWTTLAPSATYQFTAGSNVITIPVPAATQTYLRLDISGNTVQGAPRSPNSRHTPASHPPGPGPRGSLTLAPARAATCCRRSP